MERIRQIWNWKPNPHWLGSVKAQALRRMIQFLGIMVVCTLVSRTADSVTTPVVNVQTPKRQALTTEVTATGTLELMDGVTVTTPADLRVKEVLVKPGDKVKAGDLLFICDIQEIQRTIQAKNLDAKSIQAELAVLGENAARSQEQTQRKFQRAQEDLEAAGEKSDLALQDARNKLRDARNALRDYNNHLEDDDEDEKSNIEDGRNSVKSAYRSAQIAYDQALAQRNQELREAERVLEDVGPEAPSAEKELREIALQKHWVEMTSLQEIVATKGEIYAPVDGVVKEVTLKPGTRTTGESAAVLSDDSQLRFTASINQDEKKLVQPGTKFTLQLAGETTKTKDIPVLSVKPDAENKHNYQVEAEIPQTDAMVPGLSATASFSSKSSPYDTTIPLAALYGSQKDYYVLVAEERTTALGTQLIARRKKVQLLEKNADAAAVSGLNSSDNVIIHTDRTLRENDRIRVNS